jgi:hypothetical protein
MLARNALCRVAVAAFFGGAMLQVLRVDADEGRRTVHSERKIGDARVTLLEYEEQFGDIVPEFGVRLWRTVLCVEVVEGGEARPKRVWQLATFGRGFFGHSSYVLSDAINGHLIIAYAYLDQTVFAGLVALDGKVERLPAEYDPKTKSPTWKNSPVLPTPDGESPKPLGEHELGMKLTFPHQIRLKSASKTNTGWRIDADVYGYREAPAGSTIPGSGFGGLQPFPDSILRFAVHLDEECKSAKIEVVK